MSKKMFVLLVVVCPEAEHAAMFKAFSEAGMQSAEAWPVVFNDDETGDEEDDPADFGDEEFAAVGEFPEDHDPEHWQFCSNLQKIATGADMNFERFESIFPFTTRRMTQGCLMSIWHLM